LDFLDGQMLVSFFLARHLLHFWQFFKLDDLFAVQSHLTVFQIGVFLEYRKSFSSRRLILQFGIADKNTHCKPASANRLLAPVDNF
jgi:hypothetical protein